MLPTMDTAALFRERLKQLILVRYPSLDRFYLESGLSKGHVSEILRGVSSPSVTTLVKLAEALDVEVKDFFLFPDKDPKYRAMTLLDAASADMVERVIDFLSHSSSQREKNRAPR